MRHAFSGAARLAGIMGWPVAHSLSPRLHNFWFARHRIDGAYVPLAVRPEDLPGAFACLPKLGWRGWNVTIPHKEAAFRLVAEHDAAARRMGAVNTVLVGPDGRLQGRNTDGEGFLRHLAQSVPSWSVAGAAVTLLGSGGAARAIAFALATAGASRVRLLNRTPDRALALADALRQAGFAAETRAWGERNAALPGTDLLVNTTSLGMAGHPPLALDPAALPAAAIVADIVYSPLATPLLTAARSRGHRTVDGLGMLLHQAVPGFAWWGGVEPRVDDGLRADLERAVLERS